MVLSLCHVMRAPTTSQVWGLQPAPMGGFSDDAPLDQVCFGWRFFTPYFGHMQAMLSSQSYMGPLELIELVSAKTGATL